MLPLLKRCVASVRDQEGVDLKHIVVDACSTDGTPEWLKTEGIESIVEADRGMYDAVNKGFVRAKGDILAYLNCDEQYLPGTLSYVADYFAAHPQVDVLFGDFIMVGPQGEFLAYRKACPLRKFYLDASYLYLLTCTMFLRRRIVDEGNLFDYTLRYIADHEFVSRLLYHGYRTAYVNRYFATFTDTGTNLSLTSGASAEIFEFRGRIPGWRRAIGPPVNAARLIEKALRGAYRERSPLEYAIYVEGLAKRKIFNVERPTFKWTPRKRH